MISESWQSSVHPCGKGHRTISRVKKGAGHVAEPMVAGRGPCFGLSAPTHDRWFTLRHRIALVHGALRLGSYFFLMEGSCFTQYDSSKVPMVQALIGGDAASWSIEQSFGNDSRRQTGRLLDLMLVEQQCDRRCQHTVTRICRLLVARVGAKLIAIPM
jgi:hypothetical protein